MIILGYPGIGKTTISRDDYRFIDLDSGIVSMNKNWAMPYCQIALALSKQGYFVFTSTHEKIRDRIEGMARDVCVCYPNRSLKDDWTAALYRRYDDMRNKPTHDAWKRAKDHFDEDISAMESMRCDKIAIPYSGFNVKKAVVELAEARGWA